MSTNISDEKSKKPQFEEEKETEGKEKASDKTVSTQQKPMAQKDPNGQQKTCNTDDEKKSESSSGGGCSH